MSRVLIFAGLCSLAVIPNPSCRPQPVEINPAHATLSPGERQRFAAAPRQGTAEETHWSVLHGPGIVSDSGLYKAPYRVPHEMVVTLRADLRESGSGETLHATVEITLDPGTLAGADSCCSATQGIPPEPLTRIRLDTEPEATATVLPEYPSQAIEARLQGRVIVGALVCRSGRVFDTWILESVPGLDEAAVAAIRQWDFRPGARGGEAQAAWVAIPVEFALADTSVRSP